MKAGFGAVAPGNLVASGGAAAAGGALAVVTRELAREDDWDSERRPRSALHECCKPQQRNRASVARETPRRGRDDAGALTSMGASIAISRHNVHHLQDEARRRDPDAGEAGRARGRLGPRAASIAPRLNRVELSGRVRSVAQMVIE